MILIILGICNVTFFIPPGPEIINKMTIKYRIIEVIDVDLVGQMNDSISALSILLINLRSMINIIGAVLYDIFGYELMIIIFV